MPNENHPPFNELTPAQVERLAILAEECSETIQIVGKILRHGYASTHPDNEEGPDNQAMLEVELGHIQAAQKMLVDKRDILPGYISKAKARKLRRVQQYLHHQDDEL